MGYEAIDRARSLHAAGRFREAIEALEPLALEFRDLAEYHLLLGLSCMATGDSGGALTYLKRAEQLAPEDDTVLAALASAWIARRDTEKALSLYLEILDRSPRDALARRGLETIRAIGSRAEPGSLADERLCRKAALDLSPRLVRGKAGRVAVFSAIGLGICAAIALAAWALMAATGERRPGLDEIRLDDGDRARPLQASGTFAYVLTREEAIAAFERAKDHFRNYRDNLALAEINRILGSNASESLKAKAENLRAFTVPQDFLSLKDNVTWEAFEKDRALFEGCTVAWKGVCATIIEGEDGISFDFLVGYHEFLKIDGIVKARGGKGLELKEGRPVEILGVIEKLPDGSFGLRCISSRTL